MRSQNLRGVIFLLSGLLPIFARAQLTYTTNSDNTLNITGYTGTPPSTLSIPSSIAGLSVASIGAGAFGNNNSSGLQNVNIPDSVTSIGEDSFFNSSLVSVTIGSGVTNIGDEAFSYAPLNVITVDGANPAYSSVGGVLFNKNQTALIQYPIGLAGPYSIPPTVTSIGASAFAGADGLISMMIGGSVTNIGDGAFSFSYLNAFTVDPLNPDYSSLNGVLFNKNQTTLIQYPIAVAGPYNIPDTVTTIGEDAFSEAHDLTSVNIPNSVTDIGDEAFQDCYDLMNVTIPNSVTNIELYAFYSCDLTRVTIGSGVATIGYAAFADCGGLKGIYFVGNAPALDPDGVFINDPATVYYREGATGWGTTYDNLPTSPYLPANVVTAVAAGLYHSLFIKIDGTLWSMGENGYGQLGNGTTTSANRPQLVASNVMAIAGGGFHTLFVKNDGSLWAMGDNQYGELGDGSLQNTNLPEMIVPNGVVAVAAGVFHSLFLKSDGSLWGMGYNHDGQLGDGTSGPSNQTNRPEYLDTNVTAIAAGNYHSLYLKNGGLWAMGYNDAGQLGNGSHNSIYTHQEVIRGATAIAARGNHSLYLNDFALYATGDNSQGEFGDGTYNSVNSPKQIAEDVTTIAAGSDHTLYITTDGVLWGTGANAAGQLGDGTDNTTNQAEEIVPAGIVAIAAGDQHTLFLESDGSLWGMGNNGGGEMGDGTFNNTNRPEQIVGPIVANGGFEMGNFDGWTTTSFGFNNTIIATSFTGLYAAQLSKNSSGLASCILSQLLPTQPGEVYFLSLWVNGFSNGGGLVNWNGTELVNETFSPSWNQLAFVVTATSTNTLLKFVTAYDTTALDDVSVVPLTNYNHLLAQLVGGSSVRLSFVGVPNASYELDRTFNLLPPINWVPQLTNATDAYGNLTLATAAVPTTNNFWRIHSVP